MSSASHRFPHVEPQAVPRSRVRQLGPIPVPPSQSCTGPLVARQQAGAQARSKARASEMLGSPLLRALDLAALTAGLLVLVIHTFLLQGAGAAALFSMRVSLESLVLVAALLCCWRALFWMAGLYHARVTPNVRSAMWRTPLATFMCTVLLAPVLSVRHFAQDTVFNLVGFWITATALMLLIRLAVHPYTEWVRPALRRPRSVLICGTGLRARLLALDLPNDPDYRYSLEGFVDSYPQPECIRIAPVLGGVHELEDLLMHQPIDEVLIALPVKSCFSDIQHIVRVCGHAGVQIQYSLDVFTTDIAKHRDVRDGSRVTLEMVNNDHRVYLKSAFDWVAAACGTVFLLPLLLLIAVAIKLDSPGPVFFLQERFGYNKRRFRMIKFRSMVLDAPRLQAELEHLNETKAPLFKMKRDPRITRVGAFLRRTSLDELPQLFNVLRGEMSLVGPRPLPTRDVQRFSEAWLMRRFSVKPGITGLWQVSGRSDTDFAQAIRLDLRYIDRWSLAMDVKILLRTFQAVLRTRGAY